MMSKAAINRLSDELRVAVQNEHLLPQEKAIRAAIDFLGLVSKYTNQ